MCFNNLRLNATNLRSSRSKSRLVAVAHLMGVHLIDVYFMDVYMFPNPKRLWENLQIPPPYKWWSIC